MAPRPPARLPLPDRPLLALALPFALVLGACGGSGGDEEEAEGEAPPPAADGALVVGAEDGLRFDAERYTAAAGEITVRYENIGSIPHTLLFEENALLDLEVSGRDDVDEATITLSAGTYTLFCDIPGHERTMRAELVVE